MIREAIDKIITDVEELYWSNATLAAFTQSESSLIEAAMRTCRLYNSAKLRRGLTNATTNKVSWKPMDIGERFSKPMTKLHDVFRDVFQDRGLTDEIEENFARCNHEILGFSPTWV